MKRVITLAAATLMVLLAVFTVSLRAQDQNPFEKTFVTFSGGSVELPGLRLQPGTYIFKLADTVSRNVVQVWTEDHSEMLGHWLFVQAERPDRADETLIMFRETPAGSTPAVQYWYYPGEKIGKEFIYPKDQAMQIAARTGSAVLSAEGRVTGEAARIDEDTDAELSAAAEEPAPSGDLIASAEAAEPTLEAQEPGAVGTSGFEADTELTQEETRTEPQGQIASELPRTATALPLSGLLGLLSLAIGLGVRAYRR